MPLTQEDQVKYRSLYFSTAKPYIQALREAVTLFVSGEVTPEQVEIAHRSAHSLTSQSKMMGFEHISGITSRIEHIFAAKVEHAIEFSPELLSRLQESIVKVSDAVALLEKNGAEADLSEETALLEQFMPKIVV